MTTTAPTKAMTTNTEEASIQDGPLKEAGDPLDDHRDLESEDPSTLSSVEKLVLHGAHMGF